MNSLPIGIRENPQIKGIEINGSILKITQLADDTTCFVTDIPSLKEILVMFKCFELCAGLKINTDKTKANYIGSLNMLKGRVEAPLWQDWTEANIHCLGIVLSGNEDDPYELNYKKRILNLRNILNNWKCRKWSLKGKIMVINNLALPPLLYVASVLHIPDIVFKEVKAIISYFIWDGKLSRIAYEVLIQSVGNGGLKLMDIETKVRSLKAVWIKRFLDLSVNRWKAVPNSFYKTTNIHFFFSANLSPLKVTPKYYQSAKLLVRSKNH